MIGLRTTSRAGGFTLLEILIVMGLMALMAVIAVPNISSYFKVSLQSSAREIASVTKETFNAAAMTGRVFRIAYDFKENAYWVESGPSTVLLDTSESKEREERRKRFSRPSGEKEPAPQFSIAKNITRKKVKLPRGVVFEDILTQESPEPLTEGTAYTHFFPTGFTEQTVIHLKDNSDHHVSLFISALIGRTRIADRYTKDIDAYEEQE